MGGGGAEKPKETAQERALAQRARSEWDYHTMAFKPAESGASALFADTASRRGIAQGVSNADIMQQLGTLPAVGVNGAPRAAVALHDIGSSARERAINDATAGVRDNHRSGLMRLAKYGRGIADDSHQGLASAARNATSSALQQSRIKTQQNMDNLAGLAHVGGAAFGKYAERKGLFENPILTREGMPFHGTWLDT